MGGAAILSIDQFSNKFRVLNAVNIYKHVSLCY